MVPHSQLRLRQADRRPVCLGRDVLWERRHEYQVPGFRPPVRRPLRQRGAGQRHLLRRPGGRELHADFHDRHLCPQAVGKDFRGHFTHIGFQRMRILGLGAFAGFSQDPANVSDNGIEEGFGFGGRVGISAKMSDQVTFGASYQSKVYMSKFNDYAGLFANDGAFDAPATAIAGVAFNLSDKAMFEVNAQYIWYRAIPAIGNPFVSPGPIGSAGGPGFGWDNIFVLKVGAEFVASDKVTWRLGYTYNEQPVPSSEVLFNVIAPGVITNHITGGFSYKFGDGTLDFAAMFAPSESVSGINPISPFPQNIKLTMKQVALTIGWSKRF